MRNGALKGYLENKTYSGQQQLQWCQQAASGLAHISGLGFIHRDVAVSV
jgi:serine/threonine protein kinase